MNKFCLIITLSSPWDGYPRHSFYIAIANEIKEHNGVILCLEPTIFSFHTLLKYPQRIKNFFKGKYKFRKVYDNIYTFPVFTVEHILFSVRFRFLLYINKWLIQKQIRKSIKKIDSSINDIIVLLQRPELYFLQEIKDIKASVYDCCDDFCITTFSKHDWKLKGNFEREKIMTKRCSFVMASSKKFYDRNYEYNPNTFLVENGYSSKIFNSSNNLAEASKIKNEFLDRLKKPVIGFVGNIRHWIDFDLIEYLLNKRKGWTFLFVGKTWTEYGKKYDLFNKNYKNLITTGYIDYRLFPTYIKSFDVGIIPYIQSEFMKTVNPNKLYEYIGGNIPVVSYDIGDIGSSFKDVVRIAHTREEFLEHLDYLVNMSVNEKIILKNKIAEISKECTWEKSAEKFFRLCEKYIFN